MERVLVQMSAFMVLMIKIMIVRCLYLWMALQIFIMMASLTVHFLVLNF